MKKILVGIDFSENSKRTIRFAFQMASQINAEITFMHVVSVLAPTIDIITDHKYYAQFQKEDAGHKHSELAALVASVRGPVAPLAIKYDCACELGDEISAKMIDYAKMHAADFICVGARDKDIMTQLFGSVPSNLIAASSIPVIVVPRNYRAKRLVKICYATDMIDLDREMVTVMDIARRLSADLNIIHINYEALLKQNKQKWSDAAKKYGTENISFQYKKLNTLFPLNDYLRKVVETSKPSLLILFVRQDRNWLERIVRSSKSEALSFTSRVPLLVYRKAAGKQ